MTLILTKKQAQAIYNAMRELAKVSSNIDVFLPQPVGQKLRITERSDGTVIVHLMQADAFNDKREDYYNKSAFAAAYDL